MTVNFDRWAIKAIASAGLCLGALALSPHAVATPLMTGGGYRCVETPAGATASPAAVGAPCAAAAVQSSGSIVPAGVPPVPLVPPVVPPPLVPPLVPPVVPPPLVPPLVPPVVPPPLVPPLVPPVVPPPLVPPVPIAAGAPLVGAPLVEMSGGARGKGDVINPSVANGPAAGVAAQPGPQG